jgi:hypothetical protein
MGWDGMPNRKVAFAYFPGGTEVLNMLIGKLVRGEDSNRVYLLMYDVQFFSSRWHYQFVLRQKKFIRRCIIIFETRTEPVSSYTFDRSTGVYKIKTFC